MEFWGTLASIFSFQLHNLRGWFMGFESITWDFRRCIMTFDGQHEFFQVVFLDVHWSIRLLLIFLHTAAAKKNFQNFQIVSRVLPLSVNVSYLLWDYLLMIRNGLQQLYIYSLGPPIVQLLPRVSFSSVTTVVRYKCFPRPSCPWVPGSKPL